MRLLLSDCGLPFERSETSHAKLSMNAKLQCQQNCLILTLYLSVPVQVDDTEVINFLLSTEIIPLCLRTMEMGSELSKTVATFIVQKILLDSVRRQHTYSCHAVNT